MPCPNPQHQRFAEEYLVDLNAADAARRAGYSARRAKQTGSELLQRDDVKAEVLALIAARGERTAVTADNVLARFWAQATADVNELVEYRRTCCRYCYGEGHRYQRTTGEMERERRDWESLTRAPKRGAAPATFDEQGGVGYDARRAPHPGCPECFGDGVGQTFVKDTRTLSPEARVLYAGVKQTKDGLEVRLHDQQAALVNVGKHLGMFRERVELTGAEGGPIEVSDVRARLADRLARLAAARAAAAPQDPAP